MKNVEEMTSQSEYFSVMSLINLNVTDQDPFLDSLRADRPSSHGHLLHPPQGRLPDNTNKANLGMYKYLFIYLPCICKDLCASVAVEPGCLHVNSHFAQQFRCFARQFLNFTMNNGLTE